MKYLSRLMVLTLILALFPLNAMSTASLDVVINEIAWMGTSLSANDEWIELYNKTDSVININGWQLVSSDGSLLITLEGWIEAKGYFLLERTDDNPVPDKEADQIYKGSLNNSGQTLKLQDTTGLAIDTAGDEGSWLAGNNTTKQTMERKTAEAPGSSLNNWQDSLNAGGSPKGSNVISESVKEKVDTEEPAVYPKNIFFNEILPSPKGADADYEWIELFNSNRFNVELAGWKINDIRGSKKIFIFPENSTIKANSFLVLTRKESGIVLNNEGDALQLTDPAGSIVDEVSFGTAETGKSFSKFADSWQWSSALTPQYANTIDISAKESKKEMAQTNKEMAETAAASAKNVRRDNNFLLVQSAALMIATASGISITILKRKLKHERSLSFRDN